MHYVIHDNGGVAGYHPRGPVGKPYKSRKRAQTRADRLNLEYGAHRYSVRALGESPSLRFRTHTGEYVEGPRLREALEAVADWYVANAHAVRLEDAYASHVTEERKVEALERQLAFAEEVRRGEVQSFSVWQRINTHLTGECVALLR